MGHELDWFVVLRGHREEWRLASELSKIDFSAYLQQTSGKDVLVLSKDIKKALQK